MASQVFQRQIFKPGDKNFKEGDDGNMAYLIREGEVENVMNIDGVEQMLGSVGQGGIFGEMAQIGSEPSMAWARAASGTTIVCITQQTIVCITQQMFGDKLRKADPFVRGLSNTLAESIRSMSK